MADVQLPPCADGFEHEWEEFEPYCEFCGSHVGYYCRNCHEGVDATWDRAQYRLIAESKGQRWW